MNFSRSRKCRRQTRLALQPLEDRCTPASVFVSFTDVDGDLVKVTASKPGLVAPPLDMADLTISAAGQLQTLNLTDPGFDGAKIVIKATQKPGGDGIVNVGFINAQLVDLDKVIVKGDLGKIAVGDVMAANDPGLNLLKVRSLGTLGLTTGAPDLGSVVRGKLGSMKVAGDVVEAGITVVGSIDGQIGAVSIGGSLIGGAGLDSGRILSDGAMGKVRIAGDVVGGAGENSGQIKAMRAMTKLSIGGSVIGGAGKSSGHVFSNTDIAKVRIAGDLIGSAGEYSGNVQCTGSLRRVSIGADVVGGSGNNTGLVVGSDTLGKVRVAGSLIGGSGIGSGAFYGSTVESIRVGGDVVGGSANRSGVIIGIDAVGPIRVAGDMIGGSISGAASLNLSGAIRFIGRIASVTIGGSLVSGVDNSTGTLKRSGAILAGDDIGTLKIGGDIVGNDSNPVLIVARGQKVKPTTGFDLAIGNLNIRGNVAHAKVFAGFTWSLAFGPGNADASIGQVTVGGNWTASSLVAGTTNLGLDDAVGGMGADADDVNFADGHDVLQIVDDTALVARIGSIVIRGNVEGTAAVGDHFGFVSQQIDHFKIGTSTFELNAGLSNDLIGLTLSTTDVHLLEVS